MAREFSRINRVNEVLMRELAQLIQQEVGDPRVGMVTVSYVNVSGDLKQAKIYVTRLNGFDSAAEVEDCLQALNHASGFLRRELARRVKLRHMPELLFYYDDTLDHGFHMDELIARANADNPAKD